MEICIQFHYKQSLHHNPPQAQIQQQGKEKFSSKFISRSFLSSPEFKHLVFSFQRKEEAQRHSYFLSKSAW